jgi:prepilin-type N-terminal cleavage/methylation domain-containing protein
MKLIQSRAGKKMAGKSDIAHNSIITDERGFSLPEMIVAMGIFMVIMLITSNSFNRLVQSSGSIMKSAESNIEGVVGLEMMRKDLAQSGYGLPWAITDTYLSAVAMPVTLPVFNRYTSLNDAPSGAPRAIGSLDNSGYNGSDYIAIKSTVVAMNSVVKKSAIVRQNGVTNTDLSPAAAFKPTDTVSVLRPVFSSAGELTNKILVGKTTFANVTAASSPFRPDNSNDTYIAYGLDDAYMRAPFNRTDYFIYRPTNDSSVPDTCAKVTDSSLKAASGIGILYKAVMNQQNGSFTLYPILDCVMDMQVVYGVDSSATQDGSINMHYSALLKSNGFDAATIRSQLKEIRVYILAQDGKKDTSYRYPNSSVYVGEYGLGRLFDFSASNIRDWMYYRWKIYTIVVRTSL